jgi:His-Xaa-Ser system radical SAM maturase HxsC
MVIMLKLHSKDIVGGELHDDGPHIRRISTNPNYVEALRTRELFLSKKHSEALPENFWGYLDFETEHPNKKNHFKLEPALFYLDDGDIVRIDPTRRSLRVLYRRSARQNAFLVTERCNNYCLMCSQPPRDIDDSYIIKDILEAIPLMDKGTKEIGLTGGEPTLLGDSLITIIQTLRNYLPTSAVHMLSNGRAFSNLALARKLAAIKHSDLMIGIPIYSDLSNIHDYVVQADGAFDETIRGILNLKASGVRVEIRVVIHRATYDRLPELATFIRRNLTFCDHVALMGLEMMGFTRSNLDKLWIDPKDYQMQLKKAVGILSASKIRVSIYNHQLCILDPALHPFNVKSISDWKNEYMPECDPCVRKADCGGFFSSAKLRYSSHIHPFS